MPEPTIEKEIKDLEYDIQCDEMLRGSDQWHLVEDRYRENCELLTELKEMYGHS